MRTNRPAVSTFGGFTTRWWHVEDSSCKFIKIDNITEDNILILIHNIDFINIRHEREIISKLDVTTYIIKRKDEEQVVKLIL